MRIRVAVAAAICFCACKSGSDDKPKETPPPVKKVAIDAAVAVTPTKPLGTLVPDPGSSDGKPRWALPLGGLGSDVVRDIAVLPKGGVAVCGDFEEEATFGALGKKKAVGKSDAFVMAIDGDGKPLWVQTLGSVEAEVCNGIAVAPDGTIAIGGLFAADLVDGTFKATTNGSDDLYVAGFKPDGTPAWLWTTGGEGSDGVRAIAAAPDGGFLVAGDFYGEVPFQPAPAEKLKADAYEDAFLAKIVDGSVTWAERFGGDHDDRFVRLAVDSAGSIYAAAEFEMKAAFGGPELTSTGGFDLALAKYTPDGAHVWSQNFGGIDNDNALGLAVDPAGNLTMSGSFDSTITVGKDTYKSAGNADILLLRLDPGGALLWSKTFGGVLEDVADAVAADATGNIVITGWFEKDLDLGKGKVSSHGNKDAFVAKLGPDGATIWAQTFGDRDHDKGHAIAVDKDGSVYVAGIFRFTLKLPSTSYDQVMAKDDRAPKSDAFVMRLER